MKKLLASGLALVLMLSMVGCAQKSMTFDLAPTEKLHIRSGLSGEEASLTDEASIRAVTENINSLSFRRQGAVNSAVNGYAYVLTWLDEHDEQVAQITITEANGYQISYDGSRYKVNADQSIDVQMIRTLLDRESSLTTVTF